MCPRPRPISRSAGWGARTRSLRPCCGSAARQPASCSVSHFPSMAATPPAEPPTKENYDHNEPFLPSAVASAASPPLPARARAPGEHLTLGLRWGRRGRQLGHRRSRSKHSGSVAKSEPGLSDQDANSSEGTPIRITFGDTVLTARLHDNATARDLAAQLLLTLTFSDP